MKRDINLKVVLAAIFVIALALRFIAVVGYSNKHQQILSRSDQLDYDGIAVNLIAGKGYTYPATGLPSSWRAPIYPIFLAAIYWIFGHNYFIVRIIQAIISALVCVIIFYIGNIMFNRKIGLLAALILAFYIPNIFGGYTTGPNFLMTENLAIFLLALLIFFIIKRLFADFNLKNGIVTGILMGLVILTKPLFALFPVFFSILVLHKYKYSFLTTVKKILPVAFGLMIIILPWTVRNYFIHKAFVPLTTESGAGLMAGNNPLMYGGGSANYELIFGKEEMAKIDKMSEVERDRFYRKYDREFLFKNYKKIPTSFFKKILALWDVYNYDYSIPMVRIYDAWHVIILIFGLFGIGRAIRGKSNMNVLLLIALFISIAAAMIFAGDPRFRYCIHPYLIILASSGIFAIYDAF